MRRVVVALALAVIWTAMPSTGHAAGPPSPVPNPLSITLDQTTQEAVVSESSHSELHFTGNVTVQMVKGQRVTVTLTSTVDMGWASSVAPSELMVTSSDPQPYAVNVTVPEATAASMVGMLVVDARCAMAGMDFTAEATANITLRPYYRLMIESKEPNIEIDPGGTASFTVKVWNIGNSMDSYELEIVNQVQLSGEGWVISLDKTELLAIPSTEYREVTITARSPQDQDTTIYKSEPVFITLKVTSRGAAGKGEVVTQTFPVTVHVKGTSMQAVGMIFGGIAATASIIAAVAFMAYYRHKRKKRRQSLLEEKAGGEEKAQ